MTEILRIISPSPGTNPICRVLIPTYLAHQPTAPCGNERSCRVPLPTTRSQPQEHFLIFRMYGTSDDALLTVDSGDYARHRRLAFEG
eukprot:1902510-Pleurochrysis_carterae.AAC.1